MHIIHLALKTQRAKKERVQIGRPQKQSFTPANTNRGISSKHTHLEKQAPMQNLNLLTTLQTYPNGHKIGKKSLRLEYLCFTSVWQPLSFCSVILALATKEAQLTSKQPFLGPKMKTQRKIRGFQKWGFFFGFTCYEILYGEAEGRHDCNSLLQHITSVKEDALPSFHSPTLVLCSGIFLYVTTTQATVLYLTLWYNI